MNASKQLTRALEAGLWVAAIALGGWQFRDSGASGGGQQAFRDGFGKGPDATMTVAWAGGFQSGWSTMASAEPPAGWHALRHRLEACGQDPDDVLEVAVNSGSGRWPWDVEVRRSTPGAEGCLASVLSTAPLHPDLSTHGQYLRVRLQLAELDTVDTVTPERFPKDCVRHVQQPSGHLATSLMQVSPAPAEVLVCPHPSPLVRATLTYERGRLVEVSTEPSAPCVEALARAHLAGLPAAWKVGMPEPFEIKKRVCTFDLPMANP